MNAKITILIITCASLLLLACTLSAPPDWANYVVTIDGTTHYAASCHWSGDELSWEQVRALCEGYGDWLVAVTNERYNG